MIEVKTNPFLVKLILIPSDLEFTVSDEICDIAKNDSQKALRLLKETYRLQIEDFILSLTDEIAKYCLTYLNHRVVTYRRNTFNFCELLEFYLDLERVFVVRMINNLDEIINHSEIYFDFQDISGYAVCIKEKFADQNIL